MCLWINMLNSVLTTERFFGQRFWSSRHFRRCNGNRDKTKIVLFVVSDATKIPGVRKPFASTSANKTTFWKNQQRNNKQSKPNLSICIEADDRTRATTTTQTGAPRSNETTTPQRGMPRPLCVFVMIRSGGDPSAPHRTAPSHRQRSADASTNSPMTSLPLSRRRSA